MNPKTTIIKQTIHRIMKVRVRIDGYIDIDEENVTEKQIEEAVYFQLGMGCLSNDNFVGEPEWDYADVEIDM